MQGEGLTIFHNTAVYNNFYALLIVSPKARFFVKNLYAALRITYGPLYCNGLRL